MPCEIRKALANRTAFSATGSCAIVAATHPTRTPDDEAFVEGAKSGKARPLPVVTTSAPITAKQARQTPASCPISLTRLVTVPPHTIVKDQINLHCSTYCKITRPSINLITLASDLSKISQMINLDKSMPILESEPAIAPWSHLSSLSVRLERQSIVIALRFSGNENLALPF